MRNLLRGRLSSHFTTGEVSSGGFGVTTVRPVIEVERRGRDPGSGKARTTPARRTFGRALLGLLVAFIGLAAAAGWYLRADLAYDTSNLIRLHVVANSDTPTDQEVKLAVRDAILKASGELFTSTPPENAVEVVTANLSLFQRVAENVLRANGYDYPVGVEFGTFSFPERAYGPLMLPAGQYQAVRVVLGEGEGANWWCILFPPLCYLDVVGGNRETVWGITPSGSLAGASGAPLADGGSRVLPLTSLTEAQLRDLEVILSRALDSLDNDTRAAGAGLSETDLAAIGDGQLRVIITDVPTDDDSGLVILVADTGEDKTEVRFYVLDRLRDLFTSLAEWAPWLVGAAGTTPAHVPPQR